MPQPDSGDNCCDCPSRTSPCDNCGTTGACCVGPNCSQLSADDCATAGGFYHGDGTPCHDITCSICGGLCCVESTPFEDGMGGFWTTQNTDCLGNTTFSGATTIGARYVTLTQTRTCCVGGGGQVITATQYCHEVSGVPVCDESCPNCDDPDPCLGGAASVTNALSGLLPNPCP